MKTPILSPAGLSRLRGYVPVTASLVICSISVIAAGDLATSAEIQTNWPRFRGWDGNGVSAETKGALASDAKTRVDLAWHSNIPLPGHSSPVIWGQQLFVSGGTAARREVFCYHPGTGALFWRRAIENVTGSPTNGPVISDDVTYAASTMATDGRRVYAMFANGDLAALNFDGTIAWSKTFGPLRNMYGFATSLVIWRSNIILQLDQGENDAAGSALIFLDGETGRTVWERPRPVPASWATPIVLEAMGKTQIVTLGNPWIISYGVADGQELWRAQLLDGEVVPSPVFVDGLVVAIDPGNAKLLALRPDGAGDVTKTHLAWTNVDNVPAIPSPVGFSDLVFTVMESGLVTCIGASDGKRIWEKNLEMGVQASPAIADGRLLILGEDGMLVLLQAGRQFRELGRQQLHDKFSASPSFAQGRLFLRGLTNLYGIDLVNVPGQSTRP